MSKTPKTSSEPRKFLSSVNDGDYYREEQYYIHASIRSRSHKTYHDSDISLEQEIEQLKLLLQQFRLCWPEGYGGAPCFAKYFVGKKLDEDRILLLIKEAIQKYGVDALRLPWMYELNPGCAIRERFRALSDDEFFPDVEFESKIPEVQRIELLYEIGAAICEFLRYWRHQASATKNADVRNANKKRLRAVFAALIPSGQGRGSYPVKGQEIKRFYRSQLFRLYQIHHALGTYGNNDFRSRSEAASKRFTMPREVVEKLKDFDPLQNKTRKSLALGLKRIAKELTEEQFPHVDFNTIRKEIDS